MPAHTWLSFGDFRLDRGDERLIGPRGPIRIGNKAFRVLLMLAENEGRLLTKDTLFASVWDGTIVSESALTSVIKELRRALGDESKTPHYIESVYGRGYRFLPEVRSADEAAGAKRESSPRAPRAQWASQPPLLYLPAFDDTAVREAHPHLAAVLREEVVVALSRFREVRLVSEASPGALDATHAFGARDYQLAVRLIQVGDAPKAFARLCRLANGEIIWADNVALSSGNIGQDVERLVRGVAAAALPSLQDDVLSRLPADSDDVYDLYFRNRLAMRGMETLAEARAVAASWEHLIEREPLFAPAYPQLMTLYNTDYRYTGPGATGPKERDKARALATRALAIDRNDVYILTGAAWCHLWAGETAPARHHLEKALELNPWHQDRLLVAATAYMFMDELDRAGALIEQCRQLSPIFAGNTFEDEGLLHLLNGNYAQAAAILSLITATTFSSELYAVLAAAAAADTAQARARAERWFDEIARRWAGTHPLDADKLIHWVLYQHPFQSAARRKWVVDLIRPLLETLPVEHASKRSKRSATDSAAANGNG